MLHLINLLAWSGTETWPKKYIKSKLVHNREEIFKQEGLFHRKLLMSCRVSGLCRYVYLQPSIKSNYTIYKILPEKKNLRTISRFEYLIVIIRNNHL